MSRPYNIPRNYKGENKILFIFSTKAFVFTAVGVFIGIFIYLILKILKLSKIGFVVILILGFLGFSIGTFKMPEIAKFKLTQKTGGEPIDQIFLRWIKFKRKKKKIYIYKREENENG